MYFFRLNRMFLGKDMIRYRNKMLKLKLWEVHKAQSSQWTVVQKNPEDRWPSGLRYLIVNMTERNSVCEIVGHCLRTCARHVDGVGSFEPGGSLPELVCVDQQVDLTFM